MDKIPTVDPMDSPPQHPLAGLDPADLLKQGIAADTLIDGAASPFDPPSLEELVPLFPQFEILSLIGKGGMGAVYKVRQNDLDRVVALKILPPTIGETPGFSDRFTREAKALAKLNHPGIVTLHEFGQCDRLYFILMEFVDGVNLGQLMQTGRISPREALAIVPQICDALQFAHDQGIIHRDIKPENILLDRLGRVKVADFGIAKVVATTSSFVVPPSGGSESEDRLKAGLPTFTEDGKIIGTPQYMAPEQLHDPAAVDHRADIYALGVVFYQMLTGELPGKRLEAPSKKVQIDVRLDEIVLRALEKEPELRYQTAREFRTVVDGVQTQAHAQLPLPHHSKRGMLGRWWWVFLIMFPLGLLSGLAAGLVWDYIAPKSYEAQTTIEVRAKGVTELTAPDFFGSHFEAIKSRESLVAVTDQLDLSRSWMISEESVVRKLLGIITAQNIRGTDLISIKVRHSDKKETAAIANAVTLNYQRIFPRNVIIHEIALEPPAPASPNGRLVLVIGGLLGLILSPLMALVPIAVLQRKFPDTRSVDLPSQAARQAVADSQVAETLNAVRLDSFAVVSFVLGLASLIVGPLGSLPAIIFGHLSLSRIRANPLIEGRSYALAGVVLGYATLMILIVLFGAFIVLRVSLPNQP